jgi:outer membrane protein TolC
MKGKAIYSLCPSILFILFMVILGAGTCLPGNAAALEACIRAALENNPDVQAAMTRIQAAEYMIRQAQSAHYPRLYVSGAYSVTDNPPQAFMMDLNQRDLDMRNPAFDPNDPDDTDNLRFSVGLEYRLYNGGQNILSIRMAGEEKTAKELQLAAVQNELIYQVTRGYYRVLQAQAFVRVQAESVTSLEENLRVATARFQAGSAVKTDVLNLDVKLAQAQEDLILAKNGVQLAIAALNTAIGEDMICLDALPVPYQNELRESPIRLDYTVIENRPELKAAKKMSSILETSYRKAAKARYPTVNAFGSYDVDSGNASDFENSYLVGVAARWEFFDGNQRLNKALSAKSEWQAAKKEEKKVTNNLRLDLHQAFLKASEAWQRLEVTKKSVASAKEALRITGEQYKEGAADITVLLTAQVGLTAQKTRNVAAYYDYLTALSNFERARGGAVGKYVP